MTDNNQVSLSSYVHDSGLLVVQIVGDLDSHGTHEIEDSLGAAIASPTWIAVDSEYMYWSNRVATNGSLGKCPLTGCNGNAEQLVSPLNRPNGVAVDDTSIYFAEGTIVWSLNPETGERRQLFDALDLSMH